MTMTGPELRAIRLIALGMTQDELASELKVNRRTIIRIEAMTEVPAVWAAAMTALQNNPVKASAK